MTLLEAKEITVSYYGDIEILKDVSLNVKKGQITSIIGPNGAGKSTLLKSLYGLLKPKKGRVLLNNMDITKRKVHEFIGLGITYVPQLRSIFPDLSVEENLQLGTWIFKKDATRVKESIEKVYTRFPILFKKKADKAGLLSGGQQKILEIGRSLLTDPEICLFDEPTATLAPRIAEEIYSTILDLKNENITIVMVDQRIKQAFDISDQIYVLELGKNKANGTREDFEGGLKEIIKGWLD
ncbi:MAG: ABC transporter ATP-binding protein [Desulfobacula sp.]|jgi:branched-chain amino acid transport system ATP-binding protein|uniref:ABC transporter ATP-binding protein n=2 Tax=Desulfobacula sp. TaxID=2593537 RepID=UPI001D3FD205|nr:ABC transporter ATP-binding protein [Desulfobacula sp.]MBT4024379.1 ABC transporter ATP-binding protein [Desulfobacula sp.]MBT4875591.1 ABC transporter ATP-binding protein [Desulfobacula sp.]MBT5546019.1 ABC transporter ATP-binding protein [Desulfobacula sp.]MBT5972555.1 ABC transporter ATP-binding protein [Desulfobacula sp.]